MSILIKILYPVFVLISITFPRNKKIWVFGYFGGYRENTKYFFEYVQEKDEVKAIWLANTNTELSDVREKGYDAVLKKSLLGYWYSARAGFTFICTGFGDVNRLLALKSFVVNFWHGTPIKKIFFDVDTKRGLINSIRGFLQTFLISRIAFYYASSEFEREIVCNASRIPLERSISLGSPRFDSIRAPVYNGFLAEYRKKYSTVILFAPTWREGAMWDEGFKITNIEIENLQRFLILKNAILIIKQHPKTKADEIIKWGLLPSDRIVYAKDIGLDDINSAYFFVDILITDVSSVVFDFLIFNKMVCFFMPDLLSYIEKDRGVYPVFEKILMDSSLASWSDLISELERGVNTNFSLNSISNEVKSLFDTNRNIYEHLTENYL